MMKTFWSALSLIALLATVGPAFLVFFGLIDLGTQKGIMTIGMILWFVAAPLYMRKRKS
jgi:hypothetical protein